MQHYSIDMKTELEKLDFSRLPSSLSDAQIVGKIMAIDNIGRSINPATKKVAEGYCFPTKTDLTIIIFCKKGHAEFCINLNNVTLRPMHLMVIQAGCIFEVVRLSEDFEGVVLLNNPETMALSDEVVVGMSLRRFLLQNITVPVTQEQVDHLFDLYKLLKTALQDTDNPFRNQMVQKLCQVVTYYCCYVFLNFPFNLVKPNKNRKEDIFEEFISLVEQNYINERRITFYADKMNLSPKYLSTVVKEVSDKYASDWIDDYVILEAKALLKKGGMNIQQISDYLHFPNQSFFGRYFKKQTGYSPKDYRNL